MSKSICTCDEFGQCELCKLEERVETLEETVKILLKVIREKAEQDLRMLESEIEVEIEEERKFVNLGYWWCPECKMEVSDVTFEEFHERCGTPVIDREFKRYIKESEYLWCPKCIQKVDYADIENNKRHIVCGSCVDIKVGK